MRVTWKYKTAAWEIVLSGRHNCMSHPQIIILMIKYVIAPKGQNKMFYWMNDKDILDDKREREREKKRSEMKG